MDGCSNSTGEPICECTTVGFELQEDGITCAGKRYVPGASRDIMSNSKDYLIRHKVHGNPVYDYVSADIMTAL